MPTTKAGGYVPFERLSMNLWKPIFKALMLVAALVVARSAAAGEVSHCGEGLGCSVSPEALKTGAFEFTFTCPAGDAKNTLTYYAPDGNPDANSAFTCEGKPEHPLTRYHCQVPKTLQSKTSGHFKGSLASCTGANGEPRVYVEVGIAAGSAQRLGGDANPAEESPPLGFLPESEWQKILQQLRLPIDNFRPGNYYSRSRDVAVLFFDAEGEPYYPMLDVIDEDDDIYVVVVDKGTRVRRAKIAVQGCDRPPVEPRVYGTPVVAGGRSNVDDKPEFVVRAIGKCAGKDSGGPQLTVTYNNRPHVATIPVNPLYRFAVGVAAAFDSTRQRDFKLNTLPGETVPRIAETRDHIGLSSLIYISFYPSARDFRKTDWLLWQRTQLFVGLDPRAFDEHMVVGAGYELTMGLNLLLGWRVVTKQTVLEEGSGLAPGIKFDGARTDLPTRQRWETGGVFLGVGLNSTLLSRLR
jgi:hypothetical protein